MSNLEREEKMMVVAFEKQAPSHLDRGVSGEKKTLTDAVLPRIAAGDPSAVEDCLNTYGGLVWSMAKRMSRDNADAEDAVQDIFIELWRVAGRFDATVASESTYVTMIARRRLIDRLRRDKSQLSAPPNDSLEVERIAAPETSRVEIEDESAKAKDCFTKLTRDAQKVLRLSIEDGSSHSEIAAQLNMPLGSVKSFARRGLLQLRDCMSRRTTPDAQGAVS